MALQEASGMLADACKHIKVNVFLNIVKTPRHIEPSYFWNDLRCTCRLLTGQTKSALKGNQTQHSQIKCLSQYFYS